MSAESASKVPGIRRDFLDFNNVQSLSPEGSEKEVVFPNRFRHPGIVVYVDLYIRFCSYPKSYGIRTTFCIYKIESLSIDLSATM